MTTDGTISFAENKRTHWAEVILPLAVPVVYSYAVPGEMLNAMIPGCRVEVVLGKTKKYAGIIKSVFTKEPAYPTKDIIQVIDEEPLLYKEQLKLWEWMAQYYMCSEGEVMAAALPTNFKLSSEAILIYNEAYGENFEQLGNEEYLVAEALLIKKQLSITEVQSILDVHNIYPTAKLLIEKNVCFIFEELSEKYKVKTQNFVTLHPDYEDERNLEILLNDWRGAPKQMELLLAFLHFYKTEGEVQQPSLLKKANATSPQLKALEAKGIIIISKQNIDRIKSLPPLLQIDYELSEAQTTAYKTIKKSFLKTPVTLLHGVTGSGKTEIYIKLIEEQFQQHNQVLYLLPEIALTAQMIRRLQKHFGGNIAIYHSKFNNQERIELWNKVRTGEIKIVLGARSSLFLPFKKLGLIIVDEEHDPSYKQFDPAPRYNARDAAIYYAHLFSAKVLLGTATPSLESYYNASLGKYGLVELNERYSKLALPVIEIINTGQVAGTGKVSISPQLQEAIQETVEKDRQVILFQNRRGYNPYMICGTCGFIPKCTHCDVSLTLHKYTNKLHCHYCASTYSKMPICIACGSNTWQEKTFGTEKIEEELENTFPDFKIARMDVDTVRGKTAHDNLLLQFEQQRIDVLVGTQMVVKGLDFEKLQLVGILDADGLLSFNDFRVNERAFQLMEQVSGRAGRKLEVGKVLLQAINVKHPILQYVLRHDYKGFYEDELEKRKEYFYPPFSRIILLTLKHKDRETVTNAVNKLAALLRQDLEPYIVGPVAPVIGRIKNQYLMEIMIKLPKEKLSGSKYRTIINMHINQMLDAKAYRSVRVVKNVDVM